MRVGNAQYWDGTGAGEAGAVRVGNAQYWTGVVVCVLDVVHGVVF